MYMCVCVCACTCAVCAALQHKQVCKRSAFRVAIPWGDNQVFSDTGQEAPREVVDLRPAEEGRRDTNSVCTTNEKQIADAFVCALAIACNHSPCAGPASSSDQC